MEHKYGRVVNTRAGQVFD